MALKGQGIDRKGARVARTFLASPAPLSSSVDRCSRTLSLDPGFRVAWFSLDLEGRWDPPAASTIDGAEVTTSRLVGALVPCGHVGYFAGCLLAEVGSISGTLTGPRIHGDPHSALYAAPGIRLSAEVPIAPHLTLRPAIDLLLALQQPVFRVAGVGRWAVPAVAAGFGLGLFASF